MPTTKSSDPYGISCQFILLLLPQFSRLGTQGPALCVILCEFGGCAVGADVIGGVFASVPYTCFLFISLIQKKPFRLSPLSSNLS